MEKLEVGHYWHLLQSGTEWLVIRELEKDVFLCECTKESRFWSVGEEEKWTLDEFECCDYVLGRHPNNVQPEWQPKEGELVWVKGLKNAGSIFHKPTKGKIVEFEGSLFAAWKHSEYNTKLTNEPILLVDIEPYTGQDKQKA